MKVRFTAALIAASCVLSGCGGSGSGGPGGSVVPVPAPTAQRASVNVQLVVPPASAAQAHHLKPTFISPATQSASVAAGGSATVVDLSASSGSCSSQPQGRVCSAAVAVSYGPVTFSVTTYDRAPQNGAIPASAHVLGRGTVTQTITSASSSIAIAVDAVVNGYGSLPAFSSWPADGASHTYGFVLDPVDFDNAPIANGSHDPYANPIAVQLSEHGGAGHAHLMFNGNASGSAASLQSSSDSIGVQYDGGGAPGYYVTVSFSASAPTGVITASMTLSPLFVSSTSPMYSHFALALAGTSSNATVAIDQAQASGVSYSATPASCSNIASATQPATQNGQVAFVVTGGTVASSGGCSIAVSDGISSVNLAVTNAASATMAPSSTPSAGPTATPTATPTTTPSPTPTPLITPAPLPTSIYVSNGYNWNTFPLAAAQAAGGTYNVAPQTTLAYTTYTSYFAVDKLHNLLWLSGGHAYPASWNGTAPSPVMTLTGGGSGGIAVDAAGNVYQNQSSFPNTNIAVYAYGSTTAGTTIQLPVSVQNALSMAFDSSGNIYVSDNGAKAIDVITNPGTNAGTVSGTVTRTISGLFNQNWGLCLDSTGRIYVVDTNGPSGSIDIFAAGTTNAASATPIETISGSAFGGTPEFCDVDSSGNLWVTDLYDVQEFTASQIATNMGGTISAAANRISGSNTTLNSATGIYVR